MVHPQEYPDPPAGQAGQEPRLPARPCRIQAAPAQLLTRRQKLRLARRGGEWEDTHMISDVERRGVHPQRPAQARRGPVQQLPGMRHQVQPRLEDPADSLNPELAVTGHQAGPVQDADGADIPGPAGIVSRHRGQILRAQAFHAVTAPSPPPYRQGESVSRARSPQAVALPLTCRTPRACSRDRVTGEEAQIRSISAVRNGGLYGGCISAESHSRPARVCSSAITAPRR